MVRTLPRRRRVVAALTLLLALASGTGVASAMRTPTDAEESALSAALVADCGLHQTGCVWNGGLISTVDSEYAFGSATGATAEYDAILYRPGAASGDWVVLAALQPQSTCDQLQTTVPAQVLSDLEIKAMKSAAVPVVCGTPAATPKVCASVKTATASLDVSVLSITCAKARTIVKSAVKRGTKAPTGWNWIDPTACSSFIVAHKNRKVEFPLVELTKKQPVIFIDQGASASSDAAAGAASDACDGAAS